MIKKILSAVLIMAMLPILPARAAQPMKGVWIATVYNLDYPERQTTDAWELMEYADEILDNCSALGFNAIFLQVRPEGDAIYPSEYFPYSKWLTGRRGVGPDDDFDALKYWVDGAHERGMELHAWINPYRITTGKASLDELSDDNFAKMHPEYTIKYNNNYYYNPALQEVRQLLMDGIMELVNNYDIDGIHMDDYFYPGSDVDDDYEYALYGGDFDSKADWRRNNVDIMVKGIHDSLNGTGVTFGISPPGVWANVGTSIYGSNTRAFEAYSDIYADTRKWALEGWVDYIAPQIYWEIGNSAADYETILNWWCDTLRDSFTKLYIGIGDYRVEDAGAGSVWYNGSGILNQLELNKQRGKVDGEIHYHYKSIMENYPLKMIVSEINWTNTEIKVFVNGDRLEFDQRPIMINDRTLVPMRAIFEALGLSVDWDGVTQTITAHGGGNEIVMSIDSTRMYVNGEEIELDTAPTLLSARTLVPVRAISEACGAFVNWDGENQSVYIDTAE